MILQIILRHSYFGGQTKEVLHIGPDELETGADIASHFRDAEKALLSPFTASYVDDDTIEITCRDKSCRYSVWKESWFKTPCVYKPSATIKIEGQEYDNNHEIHATVRLLPHIQPGWDMLKVTRESKTALFRRELLSFGVHLDNEALCGKRYDWLKKIMVLDDNSSSLTLRLHGLVDRDITLDCQDAPEVEDNGLIFSLISQSVIINEWDMIESKPLSIRVDSSYLKESETDCDAAYLIAECIQEKHPEAIEVIADYMRSAYELGSSDAEAWLKDYHSDDGRFDAYC